MISNAPGKAMSCWEEFTKAVSAKRHRHFSSPLPVLQSLYPRTRYLVD